MTFPIHMNDLEAFVAQLRREGFDARTDLFNGQVGLIVGPHGLDPKRMPPDTAGLFFPLWELNYTGNRPLVEARKFHEIFENRPSDWRFNRPYQRSAEHERLNLRHWNRSASLLGDRKLEEEIQQELIRRFPPSDFPVNIDVVGAQDVTYAVVKVTNFTAGIEEDAKAIPEDFLGAGEMKAAVVTAAECLISDLQKRQRLPIPPQRRDGDQIKTTLTLRPIAHAGEGPDLRNWDQIVQYEVQQLPPGERAWIANFGGRYRESWRILRAKGEFQSDWSGDYATAEAALAALQRELDTHMRQIETMKGKGTVTSRDGTQQVSVQYELHLYQQEIPAGTLADPTATLPGLKEIRGHVKPVCFFGQNGLTLQMQDGRKLQFFFTDTEGSIALNRWIG